MKRELLVEIWLTSANGNRREAKNQKRVLSGTQKGQAHTRVRRTHERPGVARRPRLTIDQHYVRSESNNSENQGKQTKKLLKLRKYIN